MKILILSRYRTRSTYLIDSLCKLYNLENLGESYFSLNRNVSYQHMAQNSIFLKSASRNWDLYQKDFYNQTIYNLQKDKFAIKLFSKMISSHPLFLKEKDIGYIKLFSHFSKICQIDGYSKIYFLDRNFEQSILSFLYSMHKGKSLYHKEDELVSQQISIAQNELDGLNSYILDIVVQEKILKFLNDHTISYTYLDYINVPNEIKNIGFDCQSKTLDANFKYENLILNYKEVLNYSSQFYKKLSDHFKNTVLI